ncbi:MAG: LytS/YhcK type 5TM receptor domain-containing protein [Halobacteriota archaeon]
MEIVSKLETIQRVVFKEARLRDYLVFSVLFGFFSIFGTYAGTQSVYGSFVDIRDLAPIVAGLVAGPYVGLAVGLIGGLHRLALGGAPTYVACSLTTMVAGLLAGLVYRLNKEKLLGIIPAMLFAAGIEMLHTGLALLISRPFDQVVEILSTAAPQVTIAVVLGTGISVIIFNDVIKVEGPQTVQSDTRG